MKVQLTYYKRNGKYYSEGEYETDDERPLFEIWDEVLGMRDRDKKLPGLVGGAVSYLISVHVPGHPHEHPHLILPADMLQYVREKQSWENLAYEQLLEEKMREQVR